MRLLLLLLLLLWLLLLLLLLLLPTAADGGEGGTEKLVGLARKRRRRRRRRRARRKEGERESLVRRFSPLPLLSSCVVFCSLQQQQPRQKEGTGRGAQNKREREREKKNKNGRAEAGRRRTFKNFCRGRRARSRPLTGAPGSTRVPAAREKPAPGGGARGDPAQAHFSTPTPGPRRVRGRKKKKGTPGTGGGGFFVPSRSGTNFSARPDPVSASGRAGPPRPEDPFRRGGLFSPLPPRRRLESDEPWLERKWRTVGHK